ncbi:MAG: hypothetical protein ACI8V5_002342 [Limisphaerales bacterium]|jgi:hypothetical protein
MLPCTTAAFTSTGKPDDFAVLCQLVVPCRPSMRFLSIGSQVSPSLPSPSRSPFPSWLQMVVSSFSCPAFLQGTCTPFTSRPCWAHTRRRSEREPADSLRHKSNVIGGWLPSLTFALAKILKIPIATQRLELSFTAAILQCLDDQKEPIAGAFASGFVRRENDRLYLYTCWHVVTGFNPHDVKIPFKRSSREYLQIALQMADQRQPGVEVIGGVQTIVIPLYDTSTGSSKPRWLQDKRHIPHPDLNNAGIYVPFWHDLVKIEVPSELKISDVQIIDETRINKSMLVPGDKCLVVGFPYGFSSAGPEQPTPIVLTRFLASRRLAGRQQQVLLESAGAPGMSGGPVFIERDDDLLLLGIYTGLIYPDYQREGNEKTTALGTVNDLLLMLRGSLSLVETPSEANNG